MKSWRLADSSEPLARFPSSAQSKGTSHKSYTMLNMGIKPEYYVQYRGKGVHSTGQNGQIMNTGMKVGWILVSHLDFANVGLV